MITMNHVSIEKKIIVVESLNRGKSPTKKCEDGIVVTDDFSAVVDGSTGKSGKIIAGNSLGYTAMQLVKAAVVALSPEAKMEEAASSFSSCIHSFYLQSGLLENATLHGEQRLTCSAVIYSRHRHEVWMFGDCQFRCQGKTFLNGKAVDEVLSSIRSDILHAKLKQGMTIHELEREDVGRKFIFDALKDQCSFQNAHDVPPWQYTVIDGFPIDASTVPVYHLDADCHALILASDGYPLLFDSLASTERYLHRVLHDDPLMINLHPATKGLCRGNYSFDDRTYLSIRIK